MSISGLSQSSAKARSRERRSAACASSMPRARRSQVPSGKVTTTRVSSGISVGISASSILPPRYIPSIVLLMANHHSGFLEDFGSDLFPGFHVPRILSLLLQPLIQELTVRLPEWHGGVFLGDLAP